MNDPYCRPNYYNQRKDSLALRWWDGAAWVDAAATCSPAAEYIRDPDGRTLSLPTCQTGVYKLMGPTQQVYLPLIPADD